MDLIQTVIDNYVMYVFGSYWFASLFIMVIAVYAMSTLNVSYINQTYVMLFATMLFIDQYIGYGLTTIIAIVLSFIVGIVIIKKMFVK